MQTVGESGKRKSAFLIALVELAKGRRLGALLFVSRRKKTALLDAVFIDGGEGGIRTLEQFDPLHTFQACSFSHSDTSPKLIVSESSSEGA